MLAASTFSMLKPSELKGGTRRDCYPGEFLFYALLLGQLPGGAIKGHDYAAAGVAAIAALMPRR
jgi:hypothetical protein